MGRDIFDGIDNELRKDAGCTTELDSSSRPRGCSSGALDALKKRKPRPSSPVATTAHPFDYRWSTYAPKKNGVLDFRQR